MSSFLYRLGHGVAARARRVLALWLVVLVAAGALAVGLGGRLQDNLTIPGTESQQGLDTLAHRFPQVAGVSGQLLFVAPPGHRIGEYDDQVRAVVRRARAVDHVEIVTDPFGARTRAVSLSDNGRDALAQVQLDVPLDRLDPATVTGLEKAARSLHGSHLQVHLGGSIFTSHSVKPSLGEGAGVLVALLVLALTFGSLLAAGMPILTAMVGVGVAMSGILAAAAFTGIDTSSPTLALMIGLAVGIDYALFIVSRHRAQLAEGMGVVDSVARSLATAGSAVIFAGVTVVIALCGLVVAGIPFLSVMGFAAAAAVAIGVLVALTVVPALLTLAGERLRPKAPRTPKRAGTSTLGARWVAVVTKVPALTVVLVVGVLVAMALPAKDLTLGIPDTGTSEVGTTERTTYDLVTRDFGPGYTAPLLITVDIIDTTDPIGVMRKLGEDVAALDGVDAVALATPNPTADLGIVQVVPEHAQTDPRTADLVREIRADRPALEKKYGVRDLKVTGLTAVSIDVSDRLRGALLPFGLVVVGLSLVLLTVVFRSVAVPLKATVGYLLSVAAALGAVSAVFEWGWFADVVNVTRVGAVMPFLPILLMGVLFGLAMDYEVFLVSRMREDYVHTGEARASVTSGFTASARVVSAAAVIMISVFAAFVPHGDAAVKPMALGMAVGVFVDAFLVRMSLIPAVLALLGDRAWWLPRLLDAWLPHLDVEGAGLADHLEHERWSADHAPVAVRAEGLRIDGVVDGVDLHLAPGSLLAVSGTDRVARRALLAALTGRLDADGRLVVLDRVLPAEAASVRRRTTLLDRFPTQAELDALGRVAVVAVDDVDLFASEDEVEARWASLRDLAGRGVTVLAGCRGGAPREAAVLALDTPSVELVETKESRS